MQWSVLRELGFHFFTAFLILIIAFLTNPETFSKTFYILFFFSIFSIISESLISSSIIQSIDFKKEGDNKYLILVDNAKTKIKFSILIPNLFFL